MHPVQFNEANYQKLNYQRTWREMAEVTVTPTLLFNGHRLPDLYQLQDLKYIVS